MLKLYSQPNCPSCEQLKGYLNTKEMDFEEIDVTEDHAARAFMIMNDIETTPAISLNGSVFAGEVETIKHNLESYTL